jgi:hypothetical protein
MKQYLVIIAEPPSEVFVWQLWAPLANFSRENVPLILNSRRYCPSKINLNFRMKHEEKSIMTCGAFFKYLAHFLRCAVS